MLRQTLDALVPAEAKVSRKRWANLRSDLSAAITASGLIEMLEDGGRRARLRLGGHCWHGREEAIANGLSRFARWATLRRISPAEVNNDVLQRFFAELEATSLVRNLRGLRRSVAMNWNKLARASAGLRCVEVPDHRRPSGRVLWDELPGTFRKEVDQYLAWCRVPDPLDESARARALAPETVRLRRDHIHLAVSAACAAGAKTNKLTSLARLVEPETYKKLLKQRWDEAGGRFTNYTRDVAVTLIAIAGEWVKVPAKQMAQLKELRSKLGGGGQRRFTEKNRALTLRFEDPRLTRRLMDLPEKLWRAARRTLGTRKLAFVELQNSLAIDIDLHVPMRIKNLAALRFDEHIHWPQGRGKPALLIVVARGDQERQRARVRAAEVLVRPPLCLFRHEIAPPVIGKVPDALFISRAGVPRAKSTLRVAMQKALRTNIGVRMSPHQFRHLAAKFALDENPGAYEHVSQLLAHKDRSTAPRILHRHEYTSGGSVACGPHQEVQRVETGAPPAQP